MQSNGGGVVIELKCTQCGRNELFAETAANHYGGLAATKDFICTGCSAFNKKEIGDIYQKGNDYLIKQPTVEQYRELQEENKFMEVKLKSLGYCKHGVFINKPCASCINNNR